MELLSLGISAPWITCGLVIWVIGALYTAVKYGWFQFSDQQGSFPFSVKQFFISALGLIGAFGIYFGSMFIGHSLVVAFQQSSFSEFLRGYTSQEWFAVEQLCSLVVATSGLRFLLSLLPSDCISATFGKDGNWKKWLKGAFYGVLFYPLISLIASFVSVLTAFYTQTPPTPQVALTFVSALDRSSVLFWLVLFSIVFLVPYVEELLFRGFLQGFFGGIFHPLLTALGTSFVFSLFHYSPLQKSSNFEIIIGLFMFSLLLSRLRVKENTVIASVGMHAAFNAVSLALFFH